MKPKKVCIMAFVAMSLGAMTNAGAYTCSEGETSLIDSYTFPNSCGGHSLALLQCVSGQKVMSVHVLSCRAPDTEVGA